MNGVRCRSFPWRGRGERFLWLPWTSHLVKCRICGWTSPQTIGGSCLVLTQGLRAGCSSQVGLVRIYLLGSGLLPVIHQLIYTVVEFDWFSGLAVTSVEMLLSLMLYKQICLLDSYLKYYNIIIINLNKITGFFVTVNFYLVYTVLL